MAVTATNTNVVSIKTILSPIATAFKRVGWFLVQIAENNSRLKQVEFLQSLSDEELARRGLTRDRIPMHVFSDMMGV